MKTLSFALFLGLSSVPFAGAEPPVRAEFIVTGHIRTMSPDLPVAEAMAVANGKIVFVGSVEKAKTLLPPEGNTLVVPPGRMVLPGFVDSHVHMLDAGVMRQACIMEDPKNLAELEAIISNYAKANPEKSWIVGSGWPVALFDEIGPRKELLDKLVPDRPALFYGQDGHSSWLNTLALKAAGIDKQTPNPPRGRIERDPSTGEPSGTLREAAVDLAEPFVPQPDATTYQTGLREAQNYLHALGITLVQDANVTPKLLAAYSEAAKSGALTMRVVAAQSTDPSQPASQVEQMAKLRDQFAYGRLTAGSAKIFVDGVMEARTAALLKPYEGTETHGILNWTSSQIQELAVALDSAGFQIHMHVIGDQAVRDGLDAIEAARKTNGISDHRHHMAHLELIDPSDLPRLKQLSVVANFQPFWTYADPSIEESTKPLIGEERTARLYQMGTVQKLGVPIVAGSDWPVSTPNPFLAIEVGMTRRDPKHPESAAWNPEERVSLETLLSAYTLQGAWVNHREKETGSLEVGKAADFIVLDQNLFEIPVHKISETKVLATYVEGKPVYQTESKQAASIDEILHRKSANPLSGACTCARHLRYAEAIRKGLLDNL